MMQQPPTGGGSSMMDQQQQHQPQPNTTKIKKRKHQPQPTTTSTAQEEEEEEEGRTLWIGNLQNWMDKVEGKEVRTLWIGDLQHGMDEDYIRRCFAHTGQVFTSKVIRNKKTGESKCYGFIEFKSHAIAERFLHTFNGTPMPWVVEGSRNFNLNWASSFFGSGGEEQQQQQQQRQEEEEDDDDDDLAAAAAASDIVTTTDLMLPQETFTTSVNHLDCATHWNAVDANSSWEDMLKWWGIAQGTTTPTPQAVRAAHQVYAIGAFFKRPYSFSENRYLTPTEVEEMLDELLQYVDSIDIAKVLRSIDALHPLVGKLCSEHDAIRAKAAKLINIMAKKYPSTRQLVMEIHGHILLYHTYIEDLNPTVQTNALDAISSLFLNDEDGISAFGENGYTSLIIFLENESVDCQRTALNLIARLVEEHNSDYSIVTALEFPSIMMRLTSSDDAEVRNVSLKCLVVLAGIEKKCGNSGQLVNNDKLKQVLQERMEVISAMDPEGLGAASKEIQLLGLLWKACYDEPSLLTEKGLLV